MLERGTANIAFGRIALAATLHEANVQGGRQRDRLVSS
jgi:hypothetical protein